MKAPARWTLTACAAALLIGGCGGRDTTGNGGGGGSGGAGGAPQGGSGGDTTTSSGSTGVTSSPFTSEGAWSFETQTSLAADSAGDIAAAWVAFHPDGKTSVGYAVSHDSGAQWSAPKLIDSPGGRLAKNPVLAVDSSGRFTLAWIGYRPDAAVPDAHLYVSRLGVQPEVFGPPSIASDDGAMTSLDLDRPTMAVDSKGNLLIAWADFTGVMPGSNPALMFAFSGDGATFMRVTVASGAGSGSPAHLCFDSGAGPGAPLHLVHRAEGGGVALRTSVNQGQSWELRPTPGASAVGQDITCAASGNSLWIAYATGAAMDDPAQDTPADAIELIRSSNGGIAFDPPIKVVAEAGAQHLYPRVLRSPSGKLHVVHYQGSVNGPAQLAMATSADAKVWSASSIVQAGTLTLDRASPAWLGAYMGFAIPTKGQALVTYADNSGGEAHIRFGKLALP